MEEVETVCGSVHVNTSENRLTVGWKEVVFIAGGHVLFTSSGPGESATVTGSVSQFEHGVSDESINGVCLKPTHAHENAYRVCFIYNRIKVSRRRRSIVIAIRSPTIHRIRLELLQRLEPMIREWPAQLDLASIQEPRSRRRKLQALLPILER